MLSEVMIDGNVERGLTKMLLTVRRDQMRLRMVCCAWRLTNKFRCKATKPLI